MYRFYFSCFLRETQLNLEEKNTIKKLKSQLTDIKSQIKELQNELNGQLDDTRQKVLLGLKNLKKNYSTISLNKLEK